MLSLFELLLAAGGVKEWRIITQLIHMHLKRELGPLFSYLMKEIHESPLNTQITQ